MSPLTVSFPGTLHVLGPETPGAAATFGRGADLDIDAGNPFLHRRAGRFVYSDGLWWVENLSTWSPIRVVTGGTTTLLAGGDRIPLVHPETAVRFEAGPCNYEITAQLDTVPELPVDHRLDDERTATQPPARIPLNAEQRLLVAALAESRLVNGGPDRLPTNRSVAERLGWSEAKLNRKLDYLCHRLHRLGVAGMHESGRRAVGRRGRLVDHLVATGQITNDDVVALRRHDAETARARAGVKGTR